MIRTRMRRTSMVRTRVLRTTPTVATLLLCTLLWQPAARAQHGAHAEERASEPGRASLPVAHSPLAVPLDAATLSALPRTNVEASAHGKALRCEGVALADLLRHAGALPADKLPGDQLARYVLVGARDGYRVLYALAELDPGTGDRRVVLADRCDDKALDADAGPLRLIAPGDVRPARWVRQVQTITVVAAP